MWGCGGTETRQAQMKQKNWERKDIEKHKQKKVTIPNNGNNFLIKLREPIFRLTRSVSKL